MMMRSIRTIGTLVILLSAGVSAQTADSGCVSIGANTYHHYTPQSDAPFPSIWGILGIRLGYRFRWADQAFLAAGGYELSNGYEVWLIAPRVIQRNRLSYLTIQGSNTLFEFHHSTVSSILGVRMVHVYNWAYMRLENGHKEWVNTIDGLSPDIGLRWQPEGIGIGVDIVFSPFILSVVRGSIVHHSSRMLTVCLSN